MLKAKYILLIVIPVLLCIGFTSMVCFLCKPPPPIEITNKTYAVPHKRIFYNSQSFEDGRVVYLECDEGTPYKCKIKQEKYPYTNTTYSCDVTLHLNGSSHRLYVHVVPFGENRTILLWEDSNKPEGTGTNVRIIVFHLNECRKTTDKVLRDSRFTYDAKSDLILAQLINHKKIVTYNDSFDIFFKDPKRYGNRECKYSINDTAKSSEMAASMNDDGYHVKDIYSVAENSSEKRYIYSKYIPDEDVNRLFLLFSNGTEKQLASIGESHALSVVNGMVGACSHPHLRLPNVTCLQFNATGELKLNFSYTPETPTYTNISKIEMLIGSIYTLPEEGFLLQFTYYGDCEMDRKCRPSDILGYFIVKLDASGKEMGRYYIGNYKIKYPTEEVWHIWKNQEKEGYYCASWLRQHYKVYEGFNHTTTCFTDDNFST